MTINIREIGVLTENDHEKKVRQPFLGKADNEITIYERCKQIEWLCKLDSNFDVPRKKVSPLIKFFYEKKIYNSCLFFLFIYHDFCNQKETRDLLELQKELVFFLSDKEYDIVNKDEIRFKKNFMIPEKYLNDYSNSIISHNPSLLSILN